MAVRLSFELELQEKAGKRGEGRLGTLKRVRERDRIRACIMCVCVWVIW